MATDLSSIPITTSMETVLVVNGDIITSTSGSTTILTSLPSAFTTTALLTTITSGSTTYASTIGSTTQFWHESTSPLLTTITRFGSTAVSTLGSTTIYSALTTEQSDPASPSLTSRPPSLSTGATAGIAVGCVLGFIVVAAVAAYLFLRRRRKVRTRSRQFSKPELHDSSLPTIHGKSELEARERAEMDAKAVGNKRAREMDPAKME